jgi:solute carrier family 45 protein 1/2/4
MLILALTRNKIVATLASFTAGMIYSSLFTIPFILLANYHSSENVSLLALNLLVRLNSFDKFLKLNQV